MSIGCNISVIVPVFGGEASLAELFDRTKATLDNLDKSFELVFVHDGGTAASWDQIKELQLANPKTIRGFKLAKNYGQNAATIAGMKKARGQWIITIDEDLQTPPEHIPGLLNLAESHGFDLVYGVPEKRSQSLIRKIGAKLIRIFFRSIEGIDIGSSFRLVSGSLVNRISEPHTEHVFVNQLLTWYTERVGIIEIPNETRASGKSGYSLAELIRIALRLMLYYSDISLRLMVYFGLITSIICFGIGVFYLYEKFYFGAELGFTSIIVAIFFSTGLIITSISIIGIYIQRIFKNQINRPVYSIEIELDDH